VGSKKIKRGPGKRAIAGKDFNLADEIATSNAEPLNRWPLVNVDLWCCSPLIP